MRCQTAEPLAVPPAAALYLEWGSLGLRSQPRPDFPCSTCHSSPRFSCPCPRLECALVSSPLPPVTSAGQSAPFRPQQLFMLGLVQFSQSRVRLFATPWTAACQAFLSINNSRNLLKLTSIESVMPSHHLVLCRSLLLSPSIFPASGSFPMSQFFASGGQSIGASASASVLQ